MKGTIPYEDIKTLVSETYINSGPFTDFARVIKLY